MLRWIRRRRFTLIALAPVAALLWVIGDTFIEDDNFRVVTPDLYRAGQLRADEWSESFEEHHYRSVINLRGGRPLKPWYRLERSFADEHGVEHYDFGISDKSEPSLDTMQQLVALMRAAPKPVLIHCQAGADQSGLAAALYLQAIDGRPFSEAAGQLSLWYGHFPWLISHTQNGGCTQQIWATSSASDLTDNPVDARPPDPKPLRESSRKPGNNPGEALESLSRGRSAAICLQGTHDACS